jgi:hypothetical protein
MEYSRTTVQGNPALSGCSISFEPYFFKDQYYFSAYSGYVGGALETEQEGDDDSLVHVLFTLYIYNSCFAGYKMPLSRKLSVCSRVVLQIHTRILVNPHEDLGKST